MNLSLVLIPLAVVLIAMILSFRGRRREWRQDEKRAEDMRAHIDREYPKP